MNAGFYNQATLVLLPRFAPEDALRLMEKHSVTIFAGVPTMYWAMLNYAEADKFDLEKIAKNLRLCNSRRLADARRSFDRFREKI